MLKNKFLNFYSLLLNPFYLLVDILHWSEGLFVSIAVFILIKEVSYIVNQVACMVGALVSAITLNFEPVGRQA